MLSAIRESHIALIIFSENYADSSWCLDELSYIMKCKEYTGQIIIPVFYNVDPSDVRKQTGQFGKAFAKHELSKNNKNKVESWKKALVDASNIAGWEPKLVANGYEARCIQEIVVSILDKFPNADSVVDDENLVGMGTRLQKLRSDLRVGSGGVRMVGIWGVGGGGKTTLAFSAYMKLRVQFHGHCFIANIREKITSNGLEKLQETILSEVLKTKVSVTSVQEGRCKIQSMLCRRNVLIVLDDVDHLEQLKALAGCHEWFGDGSRILITTRDLHLLITHRVDVVSDISLLSHDEALRLFNRRAYNENKLVEDYKMLSQRVVHYAAGLPLALIVLGSFLYDKDKDEWLSTLDRLKYIPETDIVEKLKISYDGLNLVEKELFLDIACFFRRERKYEAMEILDACGFHPAIGVNVLIQKALITVSEYGEFDMHDLVQEMGHYIVRGEHPYNPEKHSRVWREEDIEEICSRNATMENGNIEAIQFDADVRSSNFIILVSNMKKLRFLKVTTTSFDKEPNFYLSNELRYIDWEGYPASLFHESFQPRKLVVLKIERSLQKELWMGYKYLPCLKEMKLSYMKALVRTPDFGGLPCLQKLVLERCESLEEIHQSFGNHASLVDVFVNICDKLTRFPTIVKMEKLEILTISECKALIEFPEIEASMDSLIELYLSEVGIKVLPSTIGECCTNLSVLSLEDCSELKSIDGNLHALKGLKNFELKCCQQFEKLPKDLFNENLDELRLLLDRHSIKQLIPSSVPHSLTKLGLNWCKLEDGDIPNEIGELSNLRELDLLHNDFTRLDFSLLRLIRLKLLDLSLCENLVELPELPSSLAILKADFCESLKVIKDDVHRRCKWLCEVSIQGWRKNTSGGERLLHSMLQGKGVKSGCMILQLKGLEIPRGFEPRVVRGRRCRMQVPENWYTQFSGILLCIVLNNDGDYFDLTKITTRMKHEKLTGDSIRMQDSQEDMYWEETVNNRNTCMMYISFGSLRNTLWWDQTSTAFQLKIDSLDDKYRVNGCGSKLIPKTSVTTTTDSSFDGVSDDYTCRLKILHDSKSAFKFSIDR
uniref:TMV resistance protein N-like n=1 Tax=Erigeron canadensis TaxID=72917 RepID=UPI001CB9A78A|nr:TMV resistance protein N-like [Erigeron canadensis]